MERRCTSFHSHLHEEVDGLEVHVQVLADFIRTTRGIIEAHRPAIPRADVQDDAGCVAVPWA